LGWLSATNYYNGPDSGVKDVTAGTDSQGIFAWIDSYCRSHHLEKLADAVSALVLTLENRP
jgi:hypothetical protein